MVHGQNLKLAYSDPARDSDGAVAADLGIQLLGLDLNDLDWIGQLDPLGHRVDHAVKQGTARRGEEVVGGGHLADHIAAIRSEDASV